MVKFDASGNILGTVAGYIPQMATADGGVIGSSYSTVPNGTPEVTPVFGPSTTFDANLSNGRNWSTDAIVARKFLFGRAR